MDAPKYSALEIERRWLADLAAVGELRSLPYREIADLYVADSRLRLRKITDAGPSGSDVTGVLALAAGVALVVLGLAIPFVHRGEGARTRTRRWVNRAVFAIAGALVLYAFVFPTSLAIKSARPRPTPRLMPAASNQTTRRCSPRRSPSHRCGSPGGWTIRSSSTGGR